MRVILQAKKKSVTQTIWLKNCQIVFKDLKFKVRNRTQITVTALNKRGDNFASSSLGIQN
jgi:hypothetical protein